MAAEDIAKLKLTGVDSLNSIGKHGRLNEQQVSSQVHVALSFNTSPTQLARCEGVRVDGGVGGQGSYSLQKVFSLQLLAGFTRWLELKKKNNITAVTAGEFSSLSEFVCGLSVVQISELPVYVFK